MELLLVRHALPNREVRAEGTGPADPGLSDVGREQAAALASWLDGRHLDALYTSPLRRAGETADPVAARLGMEPIVEPDVAEWDRDSSLYLPTEELRVEAPDAWAALRDGSFEDLGIDLRAFRTRVVTSLSRIAADHPSQRVAVVCHGGVINVFAAEVLGLSLPLFFEPGYTSISRVFVSRSGQRGIGSLNEQPHLVVG